MNGIAQLFIGFAVGCWGYIQIPVRPEDGCITLLVGGLLMVSSLGRLLGAAESSIQPGEAESESD